MLLVIRQGKLLMNRIVQHYTSPAMTDCLLYHKEQHQVLLESLAKPTYHNQSQIEGEILPPM